MKKAVVLSFLLFIAIIVETSPLYYVRFSPVLTAGHICLDLVKIPFNEILLTEHFICSELCRTHEKLNVWI